MDSIIFDVDGTLWDSTDIVAVAWTKIVQQEGKHMTITSDKLHQLFGQLLPDIAKALFPEEPHTRQMELIEACCQEEHRQLLATPADTYPGLKETLQILSQKYALFIVSNCQAGYIEVFLETTGLKRYFKGHLCPGDTGKAKGANIKQIIKKYQLNSPVYVGDTLGDYNATQEAGIPFVFASYGFGKVSKPDYIITQPADLLTLF